MTQKEFFKELEKGYANNVAISRRKNADYAGDNDPFRNFRAAELLGTPLEKGILLRMSDKLVRASNLIDKKAKVKDESITDTLSDLANYAMILKVYIDQKSRGKRQG